MKKTKIFSKMVLGVVSLVFIVSALFGIGVKGEDNSVQNQAIDNGTKWIIDNQNENGSWGSSQLEFIATTEIIKSLKANDALQGNILAGQDYLDKIDCKNYDIGARVLSSIDDEDKSKQIIEYILAGQNIDGGWGVNRGYQSDVLDSVLVIEALIMKANNEQKTIGEGIKYILSQQNNNGSWSYAGNENGNIALTAKTINTLNYYSIKFNLQDQNIKEAMLKGGNYLLSLKNKENNWGLTKDTYLNTLLAYQSVMITLGYEKVSSFEDIVIRTQNNNGSWFEDQYLTALSIKLLNLKLASTNAKINSIKLYKNEDIVNESYTFDPYDIVNFVVDSERDLENTTMQFFIKDTTGKIVNINNEGNKSWNCKNSLPGNYTAIVQIVDNATGIIIASQEREFIINSNFSILSGKIITNPSAGVVNSATNVKYQLQLDVDANMEKQISIKSYIYDSGNLLKGSQQDVIIGYSSQKYLFEAGDFTPDFSTTKDYQIVVEAYDGDTLLIRTEKTFSILSSVPKLGISAYQKLSKNIMTPGADSVDVAINLKGEGLEEIGNRKPIDLILCIDASRSMKFGDIFNVYSSPNRLDYAKAASINILDMMKTQDRVGLVYFSDNAYSVGKISSDITTMKKMINQIPAILGTNIGEGIKKSTEKLTIQGAEGSDKVIILISDGESDRAKAIAEANIARDHGFKINTIALGEDADTYLMSQIAEITGGKFYHAPKMAQLIDLMNILGDEIFNGAGTNIQLETTIPTGKMTVDPSKMMPIPTSTTLNPDGSIAVKWNLNQINIGEEKSFTINYIGNDLMPEEEIVLTQDSKLSYIDKNGLSVIKALEPLSILVSKDILDSKIFSDRIYYEHGEEVTINCETQNLTDNFKSYLGKVEILDKNGNLVYLVADNISGSWNPNETKLFIKNWNTGNTLAGNYFIRLSWMDNSKVVATSQCSMVINADENISSNIKVDKYSYYSNENVNMTSVISNLSVNSIETNLLVKTYIKDSQGLVVANYENTISDLWTQKKASLINNWYTGLYPPGTYSVELEVYKNDVKISTGATHFSIESSLVESNSLKGSLSIPDKNIYPIDKADIKYEIENIGNVDIDNITLRLRIIEPVTQEVVVTLTDSTSLSVSEIFNGEKIWEHEALKNGTYLVVYDAITSNGYEVALDSSFLTVEKPFETTISKVVRSRVLVLAESQGNIDLAKNTLEEMDIYYKVVSDNKAFMEELRTGDYNLYVLLDGKKPLTGSEDKELAAEIEKGKGLLASRGANGDNLKNLGLFGVKFTGSLPSSNYNLSFVKNSVFDNLSISGNSKVQKLVIEGGEQLGALNSKLGVYPGVVTSKYYEGKTLLFAFDLASSSGNVSDLLKEGIKFISPAVDVESDLVEIDVCVKGITNVDGQLELSLPDVGEIIWINPSDNWNFVSEAGGEDHFRALIRVPEGVVDFPVKVESSYLVNGEMIVFDLTEITVNGNFAE